MASIISAGTTSGTSLNLSGDTSGVLQLATNGSTTAITVDTSQNVGIGTGSPSKLLDVAGNAAITGTGVLSLQRPIVPVFGQGTPQLVFQYYTTGTTYTTGAQIQAIADGSWSSTSAPTNMLFYTCPSASTTIAERMRIDSSGRVGIGETTPNNTLSIKAAVATTLLTSSTGTNTVYTQYTNSAGSFYVGRDNSTGGAFGATYGSYLYSEGAYPLVTWINGTERMRIISSGFVKVSNFGSYNNVGSSTHEFNTNISNDYAFYVGATNASYAADGLTISFTQRSAANSFAAWKVYTTGGNTLAYLRGDGNAYTDGTWNNNGADYAEFFESVTGQAIPVGSTVVLENNKVRIATQSDNPTDVIGVVRPKEPSKASMIIGNTAWNKWANKYLTDDFDRYIMEDHDVVEWTDEDGKQHSYESNNIPEDITVPADAIIKTHDEKGIKFQHYKLNPAWDPNAEYVNRENRDEWLIIGLVGQVKVLKGQVMGDRWKKMRDVSSSVEEWFIR